MSERSFKKFPVPKMESSNYFQDKLVVKYTSPQNYPLKLLRSTVAQVGGI